MVAGFKLKAVPEDHWRIWSRRSETSPQSPREENPTTPTTEALPVPYNCPTDRLVPFAGLASSLQYNTYAFTIQ